MVFELIVPELSKKGNVKDYVIGTLIKYWPLTLKEIYSRIKKKYRFSGSYQAVFKAVNELMDKKVLLKKGKHYEMNISWIKKLQSFTDIVETNYYAEDKEKESENESKIKKENIQILNFSSVFDAEKYLYYFVKNELKKLKNKDVIYEINHLWKSVFYYRAEYNYYTKLSKLGHKFYLFISGSSRTEKEAKEFYNKLGVNIFSIKNSVTDKIIFNNYYIEIFIPQNLSKKIKLLLKEEKFYELLKILEEENQIRVIVHKDKELAQEIFKKYLKKGRQN